MFQCPSASRARFKLGRESETVPNSNRPASKAVQLQAGRQRVRTQKIFVAEVGIVRDADEMGLDACAVEQTEIEPGNVDGAAKARCEMRDQVAARGAGAQGARKSEARGEKQHAARSVSHAATFAGHPRRQELLQKAGEKESVVMGRRIELNSGHVEKQCPP